MELVKKVRDGRSVVMFNERLNQTAKTKQLDVHVRYWMKFKHNIRGCSSWAIQMLRTCNYFSILYTKKYILPCYLLKLWLFFQISKCTVSALINNTFAFTIIITIAYILLFIKMSLKSSTFALRMPVTPYFKAILYLCMNYVPVYKSILINSQSLSYCEIMVIIQRSLWL